MAVPFFATLPCAFVAAAVVSVAFEQTLFRRLYRAGELDQVLLTIGIVFISVAVAAYIFGTDQQPLQLPAYLRTSLTFMGLRFAVYRLILIGLALLITLALVAGIEYTRFGAQVRAAVDNPRRRQWDWASTSSACSASPSRSVRRWRVSAARWASTCLASIRPPRSSTWCTSCSSSPSAARGRFVARWWRRSCSACATSRANITCRRSAPSSSMR